jgi:hypothetical protein
MANRGNEAQSRISPPFPKEIQQNVAIRVCGSARIRTTLPLCSCKSVVENPNQFSGEAF